MFIGIEDFSALCIISRDRLPTLKIVFAANCCPCQLETLQFRNVKFTEITSYEFKFFLTDFKREDS